MCSELKRDIEVSDDHLLLTDVMNEYGITVKELVMLTGRAAPTVYRYCSGDSTIPSVIWRSLYKQTKDHRITELITGDVPVMAVPLTADDDVFSAPTDDRLYMKNLCQMRQKQLDCEKDLLDILADGVVNARDKKTIARYKKNFPKMLAGQVQIFQAVTNRYDLRAGSNKE